MKITTVRASVNECSEYAKSSIIGAVLYFTSYVSQTIMSHATQHNVPAHKSNISQKMIVGESLTFSFTMIIRRLLLFARLSYYFTPVLGSQSLPPSSRLPFWPAGFILPPIIEILMIYFFQYGSFWGGVESPTKFR